VCLYVCLLVCVHVCLCFKISTLVVNKLLPPPRRLCVRLFLYRAGLVSVFYVGIGIRYFSAFFKVGIGIGILKYRDFRIAFIRPLLLDMY